jgi:hypothetical protein
MAAGYRGFAFRWLGGLSAPVDSPSTGCECPTYKHDGSLSNQWTSDSCDTLRPDLPFTIPIFRLYKFGSQPITYKTDQTLVNQWGRGTCNG